MEMDETEQYTGCFLTIHRLWNQNEKEDFAKVLKDYLKSVSNPYKLGSVCIKLCPDLYKNKGSGMAANIVVVLQSFLDKTKKNYSRCLTEAMQMDMFQVAVKQKNTGMMRLLVKTYRLKSLNHLILPKLREMIVRKEYKDVCILAALLDLQGQFSTQELLIPLFCLDRLCLADEFLNSSPKHQVELLLFIDSVIGKEPQALETLKKFNIMDVQKFKPSKALSNIAAKMLKRFKLDMSMCPHLYKKRALGGLRYLFYKYYIEKGLEMTAFHSLVEDTLRETPYLKNDLMCLFCEYCDPQSAVPYVEKLGINLEELPVVISEAVKNGPIQSQDGQSHSSTHPAEEELWGEEESVDSYSLTVPSENIVFVNTTSGFKKCMKELARCKVLGLDAEWKPTFGIGNNEQVALLQLATLTHVYLVDILSLQPLFEQHHWTTLGHLFTDPKILKLGYGIRGDFKALSKLNDLFKRSITSSKNVLDFDLKKAILLEVKPEIFSFSPSSYRGLSDLVYRCFGKPLDKGQQFSNWANRPLTKAQEKYAALDARCLIDIFDYINTRANELDISDWQSLKPKANEKKKGEKKKKRHPISSPNKVQYVERSQDPIAAKDFRVVCDTMLQGLAKKLRLCGIDAVALDNGQSCDDCIDYYEKEKRIVLSRGASYRRLSKFIPAEYICHVESEGVREQLNEVMKIFKIEMAPGDLYSRCMKCNGSSYIIVPSMVIKELQKVNVPSNNDCWVALKGGQINLRSGYTDSGVLVDVSKIVPAIIEHVQLFYVCKRCGKCFWDSQREDCSFKELVRNFMKSNDQENEAKSIKNLNSSDIFCDDSDNTSNAEEDVSLEGCSFDSCGLDKHLADITFEDESDDC